ncbi:MAG: MaoC family dehydratase N-terminal domain-containing protein [Pseudomonadota bacterium]
MTDLDMDHLKSWIGRKDVASETINEGLMARFEATTGLAATETGTVPDGLHWCLAPPAVPMDELGVDGHPARGGFLPPVPLPNRMWAGGSLHFHAGLKIGDRVTRTSTIADAKLKEGRSGRLCFVTVNHEIGAKGALCIEEMQTIVYRDPTDLSQKPAGDNRSHEAEERPAPLHKMKTGLMSEVRLFRYSAITFNGHRIHYDHPHVTGVEGYPGLVVHGPLQATYLAAFARKHAPSPLMTFSFRGVAPMIAGTAITLEADADGDNGFQLRCLNDNGTITMQARATW